VLDQYPILKYRVRNYLNGWGARGLRKNDAHRCHLVKDDCVVAGQWHFPCGVYLREKGVPIGKINSKMRDERVAWFRTHNTYDDPICRQYCSDIYIEYNNRCEFMLKEKEQVEILSPLAMSQQVP
jgi:hypothetical protein